MFQQTSTTSSAKATRSLTFSACIAVLAATGIAVLAFGPASQAATAHDYKAGTIKIDHPWTRVTPPDAKVAGGFMSLTNTGGEADRLIGGTFSLAERVELHEMKIESGLMTMKELKDGLEIAPGETVTLKPGGYHTMFIGLKASPKLDERVAGTLEFAKAGKVDVMYAVAPLGAKTLDDQSGGKATDHSGHDHSGHDHSADKHGEASKTQNEGKGNHHDHN